ncbi:MAG: hypothetical protein QOK40_2571 [Miltoncostaeaceae bacterium]|jgi:uncharacterized NAD(P)/FAD-binding protein YdhS|nr:hypothetical protein [Miltoncostaeaceae bacterium]
MGFARDEHGALLDPDGVPSRSLFTMGPTRRGHLLESTAIPEIRLQARDLALLLERLQSPELATDARRAGHAGPLPSGAGATAPRTVR